MAAGGSPPEAWAWVSIFSPRVIVRRSVRCGTIIEGQPNAPESGKPHQLPNPAFRETALFEACMYHTPTPQGHAQFVGRKTAYDERNSLVFSPFILFWTRGRLAVRSIDGAKQAEHAPAAVLPSMPRSLPGRPPGSPRTCSNPNMRLPARFAVRAGRASSPGVAQPIRQVGRRLALPLKAWEAAPFHCSFDAGARSNHPGACWQSRDDVRVIPGRQTKRTICDCGRLIVAMQRRSRSDLAESRLLMALMVPRRFENVRRSALHQDCSLLAAFAPSG